MEANFYCLMLFIIVVHIEPPLEITLEVKKDFHLMKTANHQKLLQIVPSYLLASHVND